MAQPMTTYVHNHVFRAAVNGTWGEDVTVDEGEIAKEAVHIHTALRSGTPRRFR